MLKTDELEAYMASFFGYGDPNSPIWFVGMEEGGASTNEEITKRLNLWTALGKRPMVDIISEKNRSNNRYFASSNAPIQKTWGKIIRATLVALGEESTTKAIKVYQAHRFAREGSECSIIELMPLPAKNIATWAYPDFTNIPYLQSRKEYWEEMAPRRIEALRELISKQKPKAVVFLSKQYLES